MGDSKPSISDPELIMMFERFKGQYNGVRDVMDSMRQSVQEILFLEDQRRSSATIEIKPAEMSAMPNMEEFARVKYEQIKSGRTELNGALAELEAEILMRSLYESGGNKSKAASLLRINRSTFADRLKCLGLEDRLNAIHFESSATDAETAIAPPRLADGNMQTNAVAATTPGPTNTLTDILTKSFHAARPRSVEIGNETVEEDRFYTKIQTYTFLNINPATFSVMSSPGKREIFREEKGFSGYEIIRRHSRTNGDDPNKTYEQAALIFKTNIQFIERLVEENVLSLSWADKTLISSRSISRLYDTIFPVKGTDRYDYVKALLEYTPMPGTNAEIATVAADRRATGLIVPDPTPVYVEGPPENMQPTAAVISPLLPIDRDLESRIDSNAPQARQEERHWVLKTTFRFRELSEYVAYYSPEQNPDAEYIRCKRNNVSEARRGKRSELPPIELLHPDDIERFELAKAYVKENELQRDLKRDLGDAGLELAMAIIDRVGVLPLLHRGKKVYPVGTSKIVSLPENDIAWLEQFGKHLIQQYGVFVPEHVIASVIGPNYNSTKLYKNVAAAEIARLNISDGPRYNIIQALRVFRPEMTAASSVN